MRSISFNLAVVALALALSGCSSIARGVTEAVLDNSKTVDTRQCEISGPSFTGVRQGLDDEASNAASVTKVLMVHGISSHLPGYSSRFQKKLYAELGLDITDAEVKTITLDSSRINWGAREPHQLGTLQITRHTDRESKRQLVFYELTWSPITEVQKQALLADTANNEGLPRASINMSLKEFMNSAVPDLLIYNGNGYERITEAVAQSVCWMLGNDWASLPQGGTHSCDKWAGTTYASLKPDRHYFVTHSLGSRITIDTIHNFVMDSQRRSGDVTFRQMAPTIRDKEFSVFMMANQLPLLQLGREAPAVSNEEAAYCTAQGRLASRRIMQRMNIVAFSDPNDLLSYPVPADFAAHSIDSRICPGVTNVSLNIAEQKNLFDAASFANPMTAHSAYMEDDRVVSLIANGIARDHVAPLISQRCKWLETRALN